MDRTRVSVIIPIYNRQFLGERSLRSALAQNVDGLEIVVVDDFSDPPFCLPDDLAANSNVRLIRHRQNGGESVARNTGIDAARGEWIAFLDSDDYWLPDTLRPRLIAAEQEFSTDASAMIVYTAGFVVDNKRTGRRTARIPQKGGSVSDFASGCWFAPGSTMLCRKDTFNRVGPCDPTLYRLQDFDWFLRFAIASGRVMVWPELAAVIETGPRPPIPILDDSARHLRAKYAEDSSPYRLPTQCVRRIEAFLDVERASSFAAQRRWGRALYHLGRSLWLVPRMTVHLMPFWNYLPLPLLPTGGTPTVGASTDDH